MFLWYKEQQKKVAANPYNFEALLASFTELHSKLNMFYFESTIILSNTLHSSLRVTTQKQPLRRWTIILTGALQSCCNEDIAALKTSKKMQETGNKKTYSNEGHFMFSHLSKQHLKQESNISQFSISILYSNLCSDKNIITISTVYILKDNIWCCITGETSFLLQSRPEEHVF